MWPTTAISVADRRKPESRSGVETFSYQQGSASTPGAQAEAQGVKAFRSEMPMDHEMNQHDFTPFPWETSMPEFDVVEAATVAPERMSIVTVTQRRAEEIARAHIERVKPRIESDEVREAFERGAGMFDFPAPASDLDELLG